MINYIISKTLNYIQLPIRSHHTELGSIQAQHSGGDNEWPFRQKKSPFQPDELPAMVAKIYYGRELAVYYNAALLLILLIVSVQYWSRKFQKAYSSQPSKNKTDKARSSNSKSEVQPNQILQNINSNEYTPLLVSNDNPSSTEPRSSTSWISKKLNVQFFHHMYCQISGYLIKQSEVENLNHPAVSNAMSLSLISYYIVNLIYCFYQVPVISHPVLFAFRLGIVSTSNIPLLYVFGTKHSPILFLTGWSYEQLSIVHQCIGNVCCQTVILHTVIFSYYFRLRYMATHTWAVGGIIAGICFGLIYISAYPFIKKKSYELFFVIHILGFVVCLPALWLHHPISRPYVLLAILSVVYDRIIRLFKCYRLVYSKVELKAGDTVVIRIPMDGGAYEQYGEPDRFEQHPNEIINGSESNKNIGAIQKFLSILFPARPLVPWHPGQHSFVTVVGCGLFESHPFTIASNYDTSFESEELEESDSTHKHRGSPRGTMDIIIRAQQGFTRRLYEQTKSRVQQLNPGLQEDWRWVIVHGPYGTPIDRPKSQSIENKYEVDANATNEANSKVVLVSGGSGVAFTYPLLEEYRKAQQQSEILSQLANSNDLNSAHNGLNSLRLKVPSVQFFWIVPDREFVKWLPKRFQKDLEEEEAKVARGEISEQESRIRVWVTRERGSRPDIKQEVKAMITSGINKDKQDIIGWAGVCGPGRVVRDVRNSIGDLRQEGYSRISVYTEVFDW